MTPKKYIPTPEQMARMEARYFPPDVIIKPEDWKLLKQLAVFIGALVIVTFGGLALFSITIGPK